MNTQKNLIRAAALLAFTAIVGVTGATCDTTSLQQNLGTAAENLSATQPGTDLSGSAGNSDATGVSGAMGASSTVGTVSGFTAEDLAKILTASSGSTLLTIDENAVTEETSCDVPEEEENEYERFAIAQVTDYVNVRSGASTSYDILGKMYNGSVAEILETVTGEEDGEEWYKVKSGNVEGYIKAEFFLAKEDALSVIDQYITKYATVSATRLNVRSEAAIESDRVGYLDNNEKVVALEDLGEWIKVQYTGEKTGYVSAEYVTLSEEYITAKSLEEEAAELARARELQARQDAEEASTKEDVTIVVQQPDTTYTTNAELRQAIIDYAMQFLGNKYVHGGQSLVSGTDCSGFTCYVLKEFGYNISRTPSGQLSSAGRSISTAEMQPGDIICYGKSSCTHVAFYIGNGQILHSANSRKGVIIGDAYYNNILGVKNVID